MATTRQKQPTVYAPELKVTRYDRVSSGMIALVLGLIGLTATLSVAWWMNRPAETYELTPVELVEFPGGEEDGAVNETLLVESPEDPVPDATLEENPEQDVEVEEVFETVTELADVSAEQMLQQYETDARSSGKVGSREGSGRRALGADGGQSGLPREQRWYIQFANQRDLDEYARQLDYFGIELGTIRPDGTLVYLSDLTAASPTVRKVNSGKEESRMYMTWQGGALKEADRKLFQKAGLDVSGSQVLHFYPPKTESQLARLEYDYASRSAGEIRRTYFVVEKDGNGYDFRVTRQSYFR